MWGGAAGDRVSERALPAALCHGAVPVRSLPQNLKKSWHPQTLRNVEKVWKAEQKHEAERKKIEELQRELQEERAREEMQRYAEDMGTVRLGAAGGLQTPEYQPGPSLGRALPGDVVQVLPVPLRGPSI